MYLFIYSIRQMDKSSRKVFMEFCNILYTPDGKDILWHISDLSDQSHTAKNLAQKIEEILHNIRIHRFSAIVTDSGSILI